MDPTLLNKKLQKHLQKNQKAKALSICDKLCKSNPDDVDTWLVTASVHAQLGDIEKVITCCNKVIHLQPNHIMAHYNLGIAHHSINDLTSAETNFRAALNLKPDLYGASISLAHVVMSQGRTEDSISIYNNLLESDASNEPSIALKANINLSLALCTLKRFIEAENACNAALKIDPNSANAWNNLGLILKEQSKLIDAAKAHTKAINILPDYVIAHSNLLLDLNYITDIDNTEVFTEHRRWGLQHSQPTSNKAFSKKDLNPNRRLRVGYVSPDFRAHSVILFITGLIERHNRHNVEVFCYSNVKKPDAWTNHISNTADHWREVYTLDDEKFVKLIKTDNIDILVDLSGHTADNRLIVFGYKPSPIQVTWLGYPNTTGLNTIDYRFTDEWADPPGESDKINTEKLIRLPNGFLCFQPIQDSPPINELPMLKSKNITFGCFNNISKVNDNVIELWARLLNELPDSRLILKSSQLSDPSLKQRYLTKLKQAGIENGRIEIHGHIASTIDHLALYHQIDVALDTFPYNGTTTTCEALWMGVPVVVLKGENHASRVGVSLLNSVGLQELIANTNDDYVGICSELNDNPNYLAELRMNMRTRLDNTPLFDVSGFAEDIEAAYRSMWVKFCER